MFLMSDCEFPLAAYLPPVVNRGAYPFGVSLLRDAFWQPNVICQIVTLMDASEGGRSDWSVARWVDTTSRSFT